jgi:hypothetical protein
MTPKSFGQNPNKTKKVLPNLLSHWIQLLGLCPCLDPHLLETNPINIPGLYILRHESIIPFQTGFYNGGIILVPCI